MSFEFSNVARKGTLIQSTLTFNAGNIKRIFCSEILSFSALIGSHPLHNVTPHEIWPRLMDDGGLTIFNDIRRDIIAL